MRVSSKLNHEGRGNGANDDDSAKPGSHPQFGKLVGTGIDESVIELKENGVRLHFPRIGYLVRNL